MTDAELAGALAYLATVYPGQEWSEAQCSIWVDHMDSYPAPVTTQALRELARFERFPSIAAFCALAEQVLESHRPRRPGPAGWTSGELSPAPEEVATCEAVVASLADARRRLRRARPA